MPGETKWSPEPWRVDDEGRTITDAHGESVVYADDYALVWDGNGPDSRRRIVACVNACAGIPTEALEAGAIGKALEALDALSRSADTSELLLQKTCPAHAQSLRDRVTDAIAVLRALGRLKP